MSFLHTQHEHIYIRHAVSYLCHNKLCTCIRLHARILKLESVRIINCRKTRILEGQCEEHGNSFPQCLLPPLGMDSLRISAQLRWGAMHCC